MKRILIALIFVFGLVHVAQAFEVIGEEQVIPTNNYSYSADANQLATDVLEKELKGVNGKLSKIRKQSEKQGEVTNRALVTVIRLGVENAKDMQEVKSSVKVIDSLGRENFYEMLGVIAVVLLVGGVIIVLVVKNRRNSELRVSQMAGAIEVQGKNLLDEMGKGFADMRSEFAILPAKVAAEVKKLDPMVITHTCKTGEEVTFAPKIVVIGGREFYLSAYVPKSVSGKVPAGAVLSVKICTSQCSHELHN